MKNTEQSVKYWNENGFINYQLFTAEEVEEVKIELMRLLEERDGDPHIFYEHPHKNSELCLNIVKDNRIVEMVMKLMANDLNIPDCKIEATQTWAYFKAPGSLGRDVHQNIFYSQANAGEVINISIAIDDHDKENGCVYYYPGSHKELICYPIPDSSHTEFASKDEERMKTNPPGQSNERGKPLYVPGTWVNGKWTDKYPKVYPTCKAGTVSILNSHVLHGSHENKSKDRWRMALLIQYQKLGNSDKKLYSPGTHMKREKIDVYN